jgi:hypothetical protein
LQKFQEKCKIFVKEQFKIDEFKGKKLIIVKILSVLINKQLTYLLTIRRPAKNSPGEECSGKESSALAKK